MDIISRAAWGAKPPSKPFTPFETVSGWVVHYVGALNMNVSPSYDQSCALMRALQADAQADTVQGYIDIEYNFCVDPMGRIFEGRGWVPRSGANGTPSSNAHEWAVCYLGGPGTPLSASAKLSLLALTQAGAKRSGAVSTVRPHSAVIATQCPGDPLRAYCPTLQAHLHDQTVAPMEVKPMFNPAIGPFVAWCYFEHPDTGRTIAAVTADGHVSCLPSNSWRGEPYGNSYWGTRKASQIKPNSKDGGGYTIVASSGETYNYPA